MLQRKRLQTLMSVDDSMEMVRLVVTFGGLNRCFFLELQAVLYVKISRKEGGGGLHRFFNSV